jgi:hypothetical protein
MKFADMARDALTALKDEENELNEGIRVQTPNPLGLLYEGNEEYEGIAAPWCCYCTAAAAMSVGALAFCSDHVPSVELSTAIEGNSEHCAALARDLNKLYREGERAVARSDYEDAHAVLAVLAAITEAELARLAGEALQRAERSA